MDFLCQPWERRLLLFGPFQYPRKSYISTFQSLLVVTAISQGPALPAYCRGGDTRVSGFRAADGFLGRSQLMSSTIQGLLRSH